MGTSAIETFQALADRVLALDPSTIIGEPTRPEMQRLEQLETSLIAGRNARLPENSAANRELAQLRDRCSAAYNDLAQSRARLVGAARRDSLYVSLIASQDQFAEIAAFGGAGGTKAVLVLRIRRIEAARGAWGDFEEWQRLSTEEKTMRLFAAIAERLKRMEANA
jgi:hypothetical protein